MQVNDVTRYFADFDEGRMSLSEFISVAMVEFDKTLSTYHIEQDQGREQLNEIIKESVKEWIESIEKSGKAGLLGKLIKIFMIVIVAITMVTPMVAITPAALANCFVAILALAASPLLEKALEKCAELMGPVAGPIVGMVLIAALMFCASSAAANLGSKMVAKYSTSAAANAAGGLNGMAGQIQKALDKLKEVVKRFFGDGLSQEEMNALEEFLNKVNIMILGVQSGLQVAQGVFDYEAKKLLAAYKIDQQWIDESGFFLEILAKDTSATAKQIREMDNFRHQIYSPF